MERSIQEILTARHIKFISVNQSDEIRLVCPQCVEEGRKSRDFKLYFNTRYGLGNCKRCQWSGNRWKFYRLMRIHAPRRDLEDDAKPASSIDDLKDYFDMWQSEEEKKGKGNVVMAEHSPPASSMPVISHNRASAYLKSRGLTDEDIVEFAILYCYGGYYKDHLIIPVFDHDEVYQTFIARKLPPENGAKKYLYPKGCKISKYLYNLNFFEVQARSVLWLVEGVFDAIHTFPRSVSTFGKHLSETQLNTLRSFGNYDSMVLMYDYDAWQDTDAWHALTQRLKKYFFVGEVRLPNEGTDPTNYDIKQLEIWADEALKFKGL